MPQLSNTNNPEPRPGVRLRLLQAPQRDEQHYYCAAGDQTAAHLEPGLPALGERVREALAPQAGEQVRVDAATELHLADVDGGRVVGAEPNQAAPDDGKN